MAAPERADDTSVRVVETTGVRPDESGTRLRPHEPSAARTDDDEDDAEELELVEVVTAPRRRAAAIPPPPPPRAHPERFDLDELLRDVARSSPLGPPMAPTLDESPPALPPVSITPAPRWRPQWVVAIVVGTTGIVIGAITAGALLTMTPEPTAVDASEREARRARITTETPRAPAPEQRSVERPVPPPPVAIAPQPERAPEPEQREFEQQAQPAPQHQAREPERRAPSLARRAPVAAVAETEEPATASATNEAPMDGAEEHAPTGSEETAGLETAASEPDPALPERPTREDVDAAVDGVMPALRACGQGLDLITLELLFVSSGRATTASTDARHLTPEQRSCLARAARGARVPPFSAPHLSVRYPVRL
jgi:hypothetical protein